MHGSVQEARHVFIENGLRFVATESKQVNILEVGFGTGLNALLTAQYATENAIRVNYVGLEAYPVEEAIWKEINYLTDAEARSLYTKIMAHPFGETISIELNFSLFKEAKLIQDWVANGTFDLIYYDAFGPRAQAEMWELPIFEKLYSLLNVGGALVTYCAQGQFKRHLKSLGMRVESLPGPPGKREMTRGTKI
jgi:tRNA U34 5-methylaminomethyl-2-thiouridine-forming methyltransferase MnmC